VKHNVYKLKYDTFHGTEGVVVNPAWCCYTCRSGRAGPVSGSGHLNRATAWPDGPAVRPRHDPQLVKRVVLGLVARRAYRAGLKPK
jgi:hypothetical protein